MMAESVTPRFIAFNDSDFRLHDEAAFNAGWDAREPEIADMRRYASQIWDGITDILSQPDIDKIEQLYREELDVLLRDEP